MDGAIGFPKWNPVASSYPSAAREIARSATKTTSTIKKNATINTAIMDDYRSPPKRIELLKPGGWRIKVS